MNDGTFGIDDIEELADNFREEQYLKKLEELRKKVDELVKLSDTIFKS